MAFDELHEKMKRIGEAEGVDTSGRDEEEARKPFPTAGREEHAGRADLDAVVNAMLKMIMQDDRVTDEAQAASILATALKVELQDDAFWNYNVYMVMADVFGEGDDEERDGPFPGDPGYEKAREDDERHYPPVGGRG